MKINAKIITWRIKRFFHTFFKFLSILYHAKNYGCRFTTSMRVKKLTSWKEVIKKPEQRHFRVKPYYFQKWRMCPSSKERGAVKESAQWTFYFAVVIDLCLRTTMLDISICYLVGRRLPIKIIFTHLLNATRLLNLAGNTKTGKAFHNLVVRIRDVETLHL